MVENIIKNQKKYLVCFKHREICFAKSENYANNLHINNFLQEHLGCPISLLSKKEISEYSKKRFREFKKKYKLQKNFKKSVEI